jgi:hypothetical protein
MEILEKFVLGKILYGDIFVIPNALHICDNYDNGYPFGYTMDNYNGLQVCLTGWLTNAECENWCTCSYKKLGEKWLSDKFPIELFMGKREGDIVKINFKNMELVLTCKQLPYRCSNNGTTKFEDALYDLTKSFGGACDNANYWNPPLSKISQCAMMIAAHERYARSLGLPLVEPSKFRYAATDIKLC